MDLVGKVYAVDIPPVVPVVGMSFTTLVGNIINVLLLIAGILVVVYLVIAGIQYITAGGDAVKSAAARTAIVNAIIGIIIILIAFSITNWVTRGINFGQL